MSKFLMAPLLGLILLSSQAFSMEVIRSTEYDCGKHGEVKLDIMGVPDKALVTMVAISWAEDKDKNDDSIEVTGFATQATAYSVKHSPKSIYSIGDFKISGGAGKEPIEVKAKGESKSVECKVKPNRKKPY